MRKIIFIILVLSINSFAQNTFEIKDASKNYDARINVEKCADGSCEGKLKVELFKKSVKTPFQTFDIEGTDFLLEEAKMSNKKLMYDYQSVIFLEDYNFDGVEDLAIRDGNNSGYGGPSYQIYLFSPKVKKFVHSAPFTRLAQEENLGMFTVDKKKKLLQTSTKSGCCWHQSSEYIVINNRPKKVSEFTEDATIADEKRVRTTTRKLVNDKWRSSVKYVKRND